MKCNNIVTQPHKHVYSFDRHRARRLHGCWWGLVSPVAQQRLRAQCSRPDIIN